MPIDPRGRMPRPPSRIEAGQGCRPGRHLASRAAFAGRCRRARCHGAMWGSVPITGTSRPPGQTDRPGSSPPKPKGAVGLPRWTTKATPAATRALMIEFFVLEQKILWHSLHDPGTRYRDTTQSLSLVCKRLTPLITVGLRE